MPAKIPQFAAKTDAEWRALLTPLQYIVTRRGRTERAGSGEFLKQGAPGCYACVCCEARLFAAADQLGSDGGWPLFRAPASPQALELQPDYGWLTRSTEVLCARCDAHLGHALGEGPQRRFCINSAALRFLPARETEVR